MVDSAAPRLQRTHKVHADCSEQQDTMSGESSEDTTEMAAQVCFRNVSLNGRDRSQW